jgi:hypothetical protein
MTLMDLHLRIVYLGVVVRPYRYVLEWYGSPSTTMYERRCPPTLRELVLGLFEVLGVGRPSFLRDLAELDDGTFMGTRQQRRFIAERRDLLYIGSPHLAKHAVQVQDYWLATNVGHKEVGGICRLACKAAGVKYESLAKLKL